MAESTTIYVNRLSPSTTEKDLSQFFDKFGRIEKATIIRNKETGDSKCYGFVQFETSQEAMDALNGANGSEIKGSAISVEPSQDRPAQRVGGFSRGRGRGRPRDDDSASNYSRGGGYARGGYGRTREYDSGRSGGRDSFEQRGRGRGRGMSRGGPRPSRGSYGGDERYSGGDRRNSDRYERSEDRYNENGYSERYSGDRRGSERRTRGEWDEQEYEEPRERRSSFSGRGGRGNPRGGYNSRGRGDYGRTDRESSRGSFSRGSGERGGFSRRGSGDRGGYGGQERHGRPERGPRDDNRDWYGVSDRRSGGDERHSSGGGSERYSRHREDDSGYSRGGRGRGAPRGRGRGRGSFSGRGSFGGGSNRSFGEDY